MRWTLTMLLVCVSFATLTVADPMKLPDAGPGLRAYKLARTGALTDLRTQIGQMEIGDEATVDDFLAANTRLETAMMAFLSSQPGAILGFEPGPGAESVEGMLCVVRVSVAPEDVAKGLKTIHSLYYEGDVFSVEMLEAVGADETALKGNGVASAGMGQVSVPGEMIPVDSGSYHLESNLQGEAKAYWTAHVLGRGRLLACQTAREEALAALATRLGDHVLYRKITLREFIGEDFDSFATEMFLRPARERGVRYRTDAPIVEIKMEIALLDALTSVHSWMKKNGQDGDADLRRLDQIILRTRGTILSAVGAAAPTENYLREFPPGAAAWAQMFLDSPSWADGGSRRVVGSTGIDTGAEDAATAIADAQAAADLDGRCKLADAIAALPAAEGVTLGDLARRDPAVAQTLLAAQQGLKPKTDSRPDEDGIVESVLQADLRPLWEMIVSQHGQVLTMATDEVRETVEAEAAAEAAAEAEAAAAAEAEAAEEAVEEAIEVIEAEEIDISDEEPETVEPEEAIPDETPVTEIVEETVEEETISVEDEISIEDAVEPDEEAPVEKAVSEVVEEAVAEVEEVVDSLPTPDEAAADAASVGPETTDEPDDDASTEDVSEAEDPADDVDQPADEFDDDVLIIVPVDG
jgi:hypothetical protein